MILFLTFASHLLFIYVAHQLLTKVVDWNKFLKGTAENQRKIQLLVLFIAIALGFLVSNFFLRGTKAQTSLRMCHQEA